MFSRFYPVGAVAAGLAAALGGSRLAAFRSELRSTRAELRVRSQGARGNLIMTGAIAAACNPEKDPGPCTPEKDPGPCNPEKDPGLCNPEKDPGPCDPEKPAPICRPEKDPGPCTPERTARPATFQRPVTDPPQPRL